MEPFGEAFGEDLRAVSWVDAQAKIGLRCRSGLRRARHIETVELSIRLFLERGECELKKVVGDSNPAGMIVKTIWLVVQRDESVILYSRSATGGGGQDAQHTSPVTQCTVFFSCVPCAPQTASQGNARRADAQRGSRIDIRVMQCLRLCSLC